MRAEAADREGADKPGLAKRAADDAEPIFWREEANDAIFWIEAVRDADSRRRDAGDADFGRGEADDADFGLSNLSLLYIGASPAGYGHR